MIGDKFHELINTGMCENMVRLISRASPLQSGDCRLEGLTHSHRACSMCDSYIIEDVNHKVMQCPFSENLGYQINHGLNPLSSSIRNNLENEPGGRFSYDRKIQTLLKSVFYDISVSRKPCLFRMIRQVRFFKPVVS